MMTYFSGLGFCPCFEILLWTTVLSPSPHRPDGPSHTWSFRTSQPVGKFINKFLSKKSFSRTSYDLDIVVNELCVTWGKEKIKREGSRTTFFLKLDRFSIHFYDDKIIGIYSTICMAEIKCKHTPHKFYLSKLWCKILSLI